MDSSLSLLLFQDGEDDDGCVEDVVDFISIAVAMPDVSQPAVATETDGKRKVPVAAFYHGLLPLHGSALGRRRKRNNKE